MRNSRKSLSKTMQKYAKYELLILDEWLMYEMSDQDKQFISELMEVRHDTCSTIFCSQYPTEDWYDKLHKSTLTEALLDSIVHNKSSTIKAIKEKESSQNHIFFIKQFLYPLTRKVTGFSLNKNDNT